MSIGQKIRELREKKKFTQGYVGEQIGVKTQQISAYEKDQSLPPIDKLLKLGHLFGVQISYFVDESEIQLKTEIQESETFQFLRKQIETLNDEKKRLYDIIDRLTTSPNFPLVSSHGITEGKVIKLPTSSETTNDYALSA